MKLTVIGGGGVRSMFLAKSIAQRAHDLHITELVFMDCDADKLRIYGGLARHVARLLDPALKFTLTTDADEAVRDADYIITTIRVGGDHTRVRDERIALDLGVLGQETTGAAGLSFAMRSVPALADYCERIKRLSKPTVKVFNFTNPAGVVSQALRDMGYDFTYGICDAPSGMLHQFADLYGVSADRIVGECYGLNHLSFFRSIQIDGREIMPELIARPDAYEKTDLRFFGPDLIAHMGCVLNEYLYYFYYREQAVQNILNAGVTRGEVIEDINRQMTAELSKMDIENDFDSCLACFEKWYGKREDAYMANETGVHRDKPWKFDVFSPDAGGYAGVALRFIELVETGTTGSMILCAPNQGAIPTLADDDIVEITCDISRDGAKPHKVENPDPRALELIRRVKSYERLAAKAIVQRDRTAAVDCLMLHPLVNSYSLAVQLVDAYFALNAPFLNA
ncbi:MAG TPA: 6-phospho-beta-glucosidase [Candidatus Butyricicoccus avicola]|nr:6-phospho-beta-glucosidase [Candidatus Butyricicoccus avicola]